MYSMRHNKYTVELLHPLVADSYSVAEVCRKLGKNDNGSQVSYLSKVIKHLGLDVSHFLGRRANSGTRHRGGNRCLGWNEVLVLRESRREAAHRLRRALIEMGREYICQICGQKPTWNGQPLVLQVDHVNGSFLDCRQENVRFLCPNCHTQTDNWGSKKASKVPRKWMARKKSKQCACGKMIDQRFTSCITCFRSGRRKQNKRQ